MFGKLYTPLQNIEILHVSLRLQKRKETNTMELENNEEENGKARRSLIFAIECGYGKAQRCLPLGFLVDW